MLKQEVFREERSHKAIVKFDYFLMRGDVAQLGERLLRMQEVRGSIPLISTIFYFDTLNA